MKIRNGFVSNSSASSFTCDLCGQTETGWDLGPTTFCDNGHDFCEECMEPSNIIPYLQELLDQGEKAIVEAYGPETLEDLKEDAIEKTITIDDFYDYWLGGDPQFPESMCPICNFEIPCERDIAKYLSKTTDITRDEVFVEIKKLNKRRKKLYDIEYINYVTSKKQISIVSLLQELKSKFKTYAEFLQSIK